MGAKYQKGWPCCPTAVVETKRSRFCTQKNSLRKAAPFARVQSAYQGSVTARNGTTMRGRRKVRMLAPRVDRKGRFRLSFDQGIRTGQASTSATGPFASTASPSKAATHGRKAGSRRRTHGSASSMAAE